MGWADVVDIRGWTAEQAETRGRRTKQWMIDAVGDRWLAKLPRGIEGPSPRIAEPLVEAFTLHLASLLGLSIAHGQMATWEATVESTGETKAVTAFVSRLFTTDEILLLPGDSLLASTYHDYSQLRQQAQADEKKLAAVGIRKNPKERQLRAHATLQLALHALRDPEFDLADEFVKHLIFDAWIGNGDRHPQNWGMLMHLTKNKVELAPMFDTAGCLGGELTNQQLTMSDAKLVDYLNRCRSGFGDGVADTGVSMAKLWHELVSTAEYRRTAPDLLARIHSTISLLPDLLSVDCPLLTEERRQFIMRVLTKRVTLLR
jgi:hypothetical protein